MNETFKELLMAALFAFGLILGVMILVAIGSAYANHTAPQDPKLQQFINCTHSLTNLNGKNEGELCYKIIFEQK